MGAVPYRILIADDEPSILNAYSSVLLADGKLKPADAGFDDLEAELFGDRDQQSDQSYELELCQQGQQAVSAVKRAAAGERYIDRDLACDLAFTALSADDPLQKLSTREIEILRLLADGKSLSGIASTLGIAYKTAANSCSRLKDKLGLERTADLIRFALENPQI